MAKSTKKTSKKSKSKKKTTKKAAKINAQEIPPQQEVAKEETNQPMTAQEFNQEFAAAKEVDGFVNVALSKADLLTFTNLMSICAQTFEQLAMAAAKENQTGSFDILASRHRLCSAFATKLAQHYNIGEPESSNVH